jgi:hypothetical protein
MEMDAQDAGKLLFAGAILVLLVTTLVAFGALFMVSFSGNLNAASADTTTTTAFTGTAATPSQLNAPIISVTSFMKAASITTNHSTPLVVNLTAQNVTIPIDANAIHSGIAWNNLTVSFLVAGANSTTNVTWVTGTCNAANKTWAAAGLQTYTDIDSSCLTPGGNLVLNFVNKTVAGQIAPNITEVNVTYQRYVTNSAYTKNDAVGQVTPTASGYYQITYTYGAGGIDYTNAKTSLNQGVTTIAGIPGWLGIIVLVFVLLVVFALLALIAYYANKMRGGNE